MQAKVSLNPLKNGAVFRLAKSRQGVDGPVSLNPLKNGAVFRLYRQDDPEVHLGLNPLKNGAVFRREGLLNTHVFMVSIP